MLSDRYDKSLITSFTFFFFDTEYSFFEEEHKLNISPTTSLTSLQIKILFSLLIRDRFFISFDNNSEIFSSFILECSAAS